VPNNEPVRLPDDPEAVVTTFQQVSDAAGPLLDQFARFQDQRVKRLAGVAARLQSTLGEDHPRVTALRDAASAAGRLRLALQADPGRVVKQTVAGAEEWVVAGRVVDAAGKPLAGLTVRVTDRDGKLGKQLGEVRTDAQGSFARPFHGCDFGEAQKAPPELFVRVEDKSGKEILTSRASVHFQPGRTDYFEIALDAGTAQGSKK
jgi:hypothetical protein